MFKPPRVFVQLVWLVAVFAAALPTTAPAASMKAVLGACSRTAGCSWDVTGTTITGCSPHACFTCNGKTGQCKKGQPSISAQTPRHVGGAGTGGSAVANRVVSGNVNNKPVNQIGSGNMRMGGKH